MSPEVEEVIVHSDSSESLNNQSLTNEAEDVYKPNVKILEREKPTLRDRSTLKTGVNDYRKYMTVYTKTIPILNVEKLEDIDK